MPKKLIDALAPDMVEKYEAFVWERVPKNVLASGGRQAILKWAIVKLNEEQAELAKPLVMDEYHDVEYEQTELWDEDGDCLFYVTAIALALGINLRLLMKQNMVKLMEQGDYNKHLAKKYGDRYKGPRDWKNSGRPHRDHDYGAMGGWSGPSPDLADRHG